MAAAVNLDAIAVVSLYNENVIRLHSVGYEQEHIELDNLNIHPEEEGTTRALIRANEDIEKHADWVDEWIGNYEITNDNIHTIIQDEISKVFVKVLECAGV